MSDPIPHRKPIAKHITRRIKEGVTIKVIMDEIQSFQDAPKSLPTFYKVYAEDIAKARGEYQGWLGSVANERIAGGSDRILELALRSKAGWNPQQSVTVTEGDPDELDEDTSAIEELKTLLGRGKSDNEADSS